MHELQDRELVVCIAERGETSSRAEAELYRRYAPRVRLYGLKHLRDEELARDLVQTVLISVLEAARASRIDDPSKLDRFVLGTCRHTVGRIRERRERMAPATDDVLKSLVVDAPEPLDLRALMHCFDQLELRAKQVVMLSFQEERPAEEIAARLSLSAGNVRVVRHRALSALRRCLDANEGAAV